MVQSMIDHPSLNNFSENDDDQLNERYNQLIRRHQIAVQMGMNYSVISQLEYMLDTYEDERYRRMMEKFATEDDNPVVLDTDDIPGSKVKK